MAMSQLHCNHIISYYNHCIYLDQVVFNYTPEHILKMKKLMVARFILLH